MTSSRRWRHARAIVSAAVLAAVSLFALITVVIPFLLGAHTYTVLTGSMRPGMPPGSLVAVRPTPIGDVNVGDVVTYQIRSGDPAVVTHRVVGTTRSTGGDRLLITRGDANGADDPPVQAAQLRGTVVLAVPVVGYPGIVFGGQERGAFIAVIGVAVVGYGLVLLAADAVRSRRRRGAAAGIAAVVLVAGMSALAPSPPASAAVTGPVDDAQDHLLVSDDGIVFGDGASVDLYGLLGTLVPGDVRTVPLWIRNTGPDDARASIQVDLDPSDSPLARALTPVVDGRVVASGDGWVGGTIRAGETTRVDVGLRMDATAGNDTRASSVSVSAVVGLAQVVADTTVPPQRAPASDGLARSGIDTWPTVVLGGAAVAALVAGLSLQGGRRARGTRRR